MEIKKDLQNVLVTFSAIFLSSSVGAYAYHRLPVLPDEVGTMTNEEVGLVDDWTLTQVENEVDAVIISSSTEPSETVPTTTEPVPVPVPTKTNSQFSDAVAKQIADQKAAQDKAAADALAKQIADTQAMIDALAKEKATADALAAQLAAEKAAADAAAKKSRKSRAS